EGGYRSYVDVPRARPGASARAAIAQAAHDALRALFPSQAASFGPLLAEDRAAVRNGTARTRGEKVGRRTAAAVLALRANDGAARPGPRIGVDFFTSDAPGMWRQDPISENPTALGAYWGEVRPFVITSAAQSRLPLPPALGSAEFGAALDDVRRLG